MYFKLDEFNKIDFLSFTTSSLSRQFRMHICLFAGRGYLCIRLGWGADAKNAEFIAGRQARCKVVVKLCPYCVFPFVVWKNSFLFCYNVDDGIKTCCKSLQQDVLCVTICFKTFYLQLFAQTIADLFEKVFSCSIKIIGTCYQQVQAQSVRKQLVVKLRYLRALYFQ